MTVQEKVRRKVQHLYEKQPNIHVTVTLKQPHTSVIKNIPVVITSVYPNMFQVKYTNDHVTRKFMHPYSDLVTKEVLIQEMPEVI